jgi:hypothetical protein
VRCAAFVVWVRRSGSLAFVVLYKFRAPNTRFCAEVCARTCERDLGGKGTLPLGVLRGSGGPLRTANAARCFRRCIITFAVALWALWSFSGCVWPVW